MAEAQVARTQAVVRNISDTARWAAYFRARETERPDALFRDPYAERLAGQHGVDIANTLPEGNKHAWAWVARTCLFDQFIEQELQQGVDMVVNLAAGLDARPHRMKLSASLQWIEVDLPEILGYKEEILANEKPTCVLERVRLDLSDGNARRAVFAELGGRAKKILVLTEGLLIYLSAEEVAALAKDLATGANFQRWIMDLTSPGLLKMMQKTTGKELSQVGATFKFAPAEGPEFFVSNGWEPMEVKGLLKTATKFKRPPFFLRLLGHLPERKKPAGNQPWSGVCLFKRQATK
ncbi:MAG TPA: class I SAM-dependent methyltransferase [Candidatus Acidoferrum sp.]|nr:class I SAM-dependent methyltransferase [Candidatus Acidoferrum sp.]